MQVAKITIEMSLHLTKQDLTKHRLIQKKRHKLFLLVT